jgi:hypothetical protein
VTRSGSVDRLRGLYHILLDRGGPVAAPVNAKTWGPLFVALVVSALAIIFEYGQVALAGREGDPKDRTPFTDQFFLEDCDFASSGSNRFFILEPEYRLVLAGTEHDGTEVRQTVTVLEDTRIVDGVETRIVVEEETHDGELVEVSKNYFAICRQTNSVIYFGEDVDLYEDGVIVSHAGAWLSGKDGARPGVMMPGIALLGARYFQEVAPGIAMDRAEILSLTDEVRTPAGDFEDVLTTRETTPLEPRAVELKSYAPFVGLIRDGILRLEDFGFVD